MGRRLVIRADADSIMGSGHVMRMIALAQAWAKDGGKVLFISRITADSLRERIVREGFVLIEPTGVYPESSDADFFLSQTSADDWIAIDGYHFDTKYQQTVRQAGRFTLVMDDVNDRGEYAASILVNQNADALRYQYNVNSDAVILRGTRYALLRKEFRKHARVEKSIPGCGVKIFVTMGGGDPDNLTSRILQALGELTFPDMHVKVAVGAVNSDLDKIRQEAADLPFPCDLLQSVEDMPALMKWADLAVSAAGSTCWELCYFGVPMVLSVVAANQRGIAASLAKTGAALVMEEDFNLALLQSVIEDADKRTLMSRAAQALVDGKGSGRLAGLKRVLFLGYGEEEHELITEFRKAGCVVDHTENKVDSINGYDLVVSYGYRYIFPERLINSGIPIINLHISYLPYNRGAHPNFWSFYDNTIKGVTVHLIDAGVDTGPILAQREIVFSDSEKTFIDTYKRLRQEIERLFVSIIPTILAGEYVAMPQQGEGTHHFLKELPEFSGGWKGDINSVLDQLLGEKWEFCRD